MTVYYQLQSLNDARDCAHEIGLIIREHISADSRANILDALLKRLSGQDLETKDRICRLFEIGLAQGVADAQLEGALLESWNPRSSR